MPDIDSLSIQLKASSTQAVNSINKIITSLNGLNTALTNTASVGALTNLTNSLNTLSRVTIPAANFEGITSLVNSLNRLGNATNATTVLPQIGTAFNQMLTDLSGAPAVNENVTQLASALARLGGANAQRAVTTIPLISTAFRNMIVELSNAPAVSANIIRLAEAMSQMARSGNQATTATTSFTSATTGLNLNMTRLVNPLKSVRLGFGSLASMAGHIYANFFLLIRGARLLGKAMDYSSAMTEAANVVDVTFGKSAGVLNEFTKTAIKDFGLARLSATEFASRFQAMGKTMGITSDQVVKANEFITSKISGNTLAYEDLGNSVADVSVNLTKLTSDIASLYNQDYEDVAKDMQSIYTGMTRPLRKYGLDLTNATIKEWAMSQGLNSNVESMTQAEKTMLRYQYVMSRAAGAMGDFKKTADTWANSMRTVKQYLQEIARVIGEALINALKPALIAFRNFLSTFLELTQKALNAVGKLLGWKQIDFGGASLVEDTEDYADALDDAAGAAKKLKGQLRGIDELNNLTTNNGSGGGAGGTSGLGADIESIWDQIGEREDPYLSDVENWKDFGQRIANKIGEGLSSINWDEVYGKASSFGTNFASFLNGLISPTTWGLFGKTLAGGLNTAITAAFSFGEEFDFENLGEAIGEGINGFFEEFDGGKLANTVDIFVKGLEKTFKNAIKTIKWREVFAVMFDFLSNLDIGTVAITIGAVSAVYGAKLVGTKIVAELTAMGALNVPVTLTIAAVAFGGFKLGEWISKQLDEALGTNPETGETVWYEWWADIFDFWSGTPFKDIKDAFGSLWSYYWDDVKLSADEVKTDWNAFWDGFGQGDNKEWTPFKNLATVLGQTMNNGSELDMVLEVLAVSMQDLIIHVEEVKTAFIIVFNAIKEHASQKITEITEKLTGFKDDALLRFAEFKEGIHTKLTEIKTNFDSWIENDVKPLFDKDTWLGYLDGIKAAFEQIWNDALGFAKGFFNNLASPAENFINGLIDGFGKLADAKNTFSDVVTKFTVDHISLPRYASGGYPTTGSLFWANERGPEIVGTMNGRTAVASNGEITGITSAIRSTSDAETALMRQQIDLLTAIAAKEFGISKGELFSSVRSSANEYTRMTGRPAW